MSRVTWSPENDKKLLLQLMMPASKDIPIDQIASLFPGATTKSIIERIAKLRREKKSMSGATATTSPISPTTGSSPIAPSSSPVHSTATVHRGFGTRSAITGEIVKISAAPPGRKRKRAETLIAPITATVSTATASDKVEQSTSAIDPAAIKSKYEGEGEGGKVKKEEDSETEKEEEEGGKVKRVKVEDGEGGSKDLVLG